MTFRSALLLGSCVAVAISASVTSAVAQDGIEIVTVTAAKREQNVQDVPISMNVIQQKELENYNLADLKDIANQIPGMVFLKTNNISTVSLRGFGSSAANPAIDPTVALYMDGIFGGRARQYMLPFFDVARMEVLRGPQGALLGKNTAAGAINIVTANPTDVFEASATMSYLFDRKGYDVFGYVSGPVMDDVTVRLAAKFMDKGGWVKNIATGIDVPDMVTKQGRLTVRWQPSESFENVTKIGYESMAQRGKAISGFPLNTLRGQINTTQNAPGLLGVPEYDNQNGWHFSNTATVDFGAVTFVSLTGVESYTSDVVTSATHANPEVVNSRYIDDFHQISQEFRVLSPTGQTLEWIAGVYADYSYQRLDNVGRFVNYPTPAFNSQTTSYFKQSANTYSAYATGTWNIDEQFALILGVRGTQTHKSATFIVINDFGIPVTTPKTYQGNIDEGSFDPSATLQYKMMPDVMFYAGWSKGSKGGAFQGANRSATLADFSVRPEISTNYEIGVKSTLWDFLTFNATAYILKFKNLQAGQYTGSPPVLLTRNAAEAESKGVEVVLNADLNDWVEGLSFGLTGNFIDARYVDYPNASCTAAATAAGCVNGWMNPPLNTIPYNGAGNRFNALPHWQGTMQLNYTRPVFDGLKLDMNLTADMQSGYFDDAGVLDPRYGWQNGNTKLHFRVAIGDAGGMWNLALIGRNVNDVLTTSAGVYNIPATNWRVYAIDETRSLMVQGSIKVN